MKMGGEFSKICNWGCLLLGATEQIHETGSCIFEICRSEVLNSIIFFPEHCLWQIHRQR